MGLLALERHHDRRRFVGASFVRDTKGLLAFDPHADVNVLFALFREIEHSLHHVQDADSFLQTMLDSFSNTIQISDAKTVLISGDPVDEINKLAALYIPCE